ncbi:MAG: NAD(P)H-hydrate dehydratase [Bdellovibrionales bacterium]
MRILSKQEVYQIDSDLINSGIKEDDLILEVGKALSLWFIHKKLEHKNILILCGPGNNGNDGLALAHFLYKANFKVSVFFPEFNKVSNNIPLDIYNNIKHLIVKNFQPEKYLCLVDALFGIGLNQSLKSPYKEVILKCNKEESHKISIDIPSGVDADTGEIYKPCFNAHDTLAVSCLKRGLLLMPGLKKSGKLHVISVESIENALNKKTFFCKILSAQENWKKALTPSEDSHKYKRGKVSFVLGENFPGACLLAAQAARQSGAGYVQIYCPTKLLHECQIHYPGIVFKAYSSMDHLKEKLIKNDSQVLVMGPGWTDEFPIHQIIKPDKIYVLDGGLLQPSLIDTLKNVDTSKVILTPHPGELGRLSGQTLNKWESLVKLGGLFSGTLVAKGYDTVVYQADEKALITTSNSPFLATAGSGDVLAGLIAGVCSQGLKPLDGACCGVHLHKYLGNDINYGTTPEKIIEEIPNAIRKLP